MSFNLGVCQFISHIGEMWHSVEKTTFILYKYFLSAYFMLHYYLFVSQCKNSIRHIQQHADSNQTHIYIQPCVFPTLCLYSVHVFHLHCFVHYMSSLNKLTPMHASLCKYCETRVLMLCKTSELNVTKHLKKVIFFVC